MSYAEALPSKKYSAVYQLSDTSDFSGNGRTLTISGGGGYVIGKFNNCRQTTSNSGVISIADGMGINPTVTGYTYSIWYKHTSSGEYNNGSYILNHGFAAYNCAPSIIWVETTGKMLGGLLSNVSNNPVSVTYTPSTAKFELHTLVYTGTRTQYYINSRLMGDNAETTSGTQAITTRFNLGSYLSDTPRRRYINGYFDEVIVEARPWTAGEIKKYYENCMGCLRPIII